MHPDDLDHDDLRDELDAENTAGVNFYAEEVPMPFDDDTADRLSAWVEEAFATEAAAMHAVVFIFCDDEYLLELNREHLQHDYYTDILTFPLHDDGEPIDGEMYISIDRVRENATTLGISFEKELCRVMIHGVLHLIGYDDHTDDDRNHIRAREDAYLLQVTDIAQ